MPGSPARGRGPADPLPDPGRPGQVGGRRLVQCRAGPHPGHRRRVGLREERHQPRHHGPAPGHPGADHRAHPAGRRGTGRGPADPDPGAARRQDGDDLPGSAVLAASLLHGGQPDHRGVPGPPPRGDQAAGPPARRRHAGPGRHPGARRPGGRLPAPVLRRHAAAGDDRHGAGQRPRAADRGRAHHGPRRYRAGADPGPDLRPAGRVRLGGHHDHPRPRRGRRAVRRHPGDVRGPGGRVRVGRGHLRPPGSSVHLGAAGLDAAHGPGAAYPAASRSPARRPA